MSQEMRTQKDCALLVIDVQQGLFDRSTPIYQADQILENINSLVANAHKNEVPVFYIQHNNKETLAKHSPGWHLHPRMQPQPQDSIIHKQIGNAFEQTILDASLKNLKVSNLVITGLVSHGCVKATCLGALALGYKVTLVKDAHSNFSKQALQLIEKVHDSLSREGAALMLTSQVTFN